MSRFALFFTAFFLAAGASTQAAELIMVEEHGCVWCEEWNEVISPIYPKTAEGRFAPLRRIDIRAPGLEALTLASRPVFTPTFILIEDNRELGRIEGYPGEDFFWGLLGRLLRDNTTFKESGT